MTHTHDDHVGAAERLRATYGTRSSLAGRRHRPLPRTGSTGPAGRAGARTHRGTRSGTAPAFWPAPER
ncbi:hypothetical protein ACFYO2_40515 [Streptomyces sp. NPDC006602]|uniref:hypothetical protein n=1 Tax=Streptomyces sp. NPDC006602 TaxID=3364751 RepID=UPI0036A0A93D